MNDAGRDPPDTGAADRARRRSRRPAALEQRRARAGTASTDDVGRRPLQRPPLDHAGLHARARRTGSRSRPARRYTDTGLAAGTYYYRVTAEDAAGNISAGLRQASAIVTGGHARRRRRPSDLAATGALSAVALDLDGLHGQRRRRPLQRPPLDHAGLHARAPRTGSRSRPATTLTDTGLAAGTYYYRVTAEDAAGNVSAASDEASAVVTGDTTPPTAPASLTAGAGQSERVSARLDGRDRQRRRRPLQRPPLDGHRLHAERREPDRAADGHEATPTPASRPAPTTTASPPRTPPATSAPRPPQATATVTTPPPAGLVAAYSLRRGQRDDRRPTPPGPRNNGRASPVRPGRRPASTARRCRSTASNDMVTVAGRDRARPDDRR